MIEKMFEYKGFICVCNLMEGGWRTGYSGFPKHKYRISKNRLYVFRGITYDENHLLYVLGYENENYPNYRWLGFDTACNQFASDFASVRKLYKDNPTVLAACDLLEKIKQQEDKPIFTTEMVESELKDLCNQILEQNK